MKPYGLEWEPQRPRLPDIKEDACSLFLGTFAGAWLCLMLLPLVEAKLLTFSVGAVSLTLFWVAIWFRNRRHDRQEKTWQEWRRRQDARESEAKLLSDVAQCIVGGTTYTLGMEKYVTGEEGESDSRDDGPREGYPAGWWHCKIHLNPETGEMHSDGDHRVREWIEKQLVREAK